MSATFLKTADLLDELARLGVQSAADLDRLIDQLRRIRQACRRLDSSPRVARSKRRCPPAAAAPPGPRPLRFGAVADVASVAADEALPSDLVEWIVARLDVRGPQTVQQLAAARPCSEKLIRRAIGKATRQIVWDDATDKFRLKAA